jgi:hypothetical protein
VEPQQPRSLDDSVNRAIDKGATFLRRQHSSYKHYLDYMGLLGLTLLECGAPVDDPMIKQIAAWLRKRKSDLARTYELSLAILFFDRLGDPQDRPLIRTFAQRLLAGQLDGRTWTYTCPLEDSRQAVRYGVPAAAGVAQQPQIITWQNMFPRNNAALRRTYYRGDNSNTQFAILALWVAQRYGVAAREAILSTEEYFRETQLENGSWGYHPRHPTWCDSMTCAGLMSLAMRYGISHRKGSDIRPDRLVQVSDAAILRGLRYLDRATENIKVVGGRIEVVEARDPLYFLWSLERMAVIYDLRKIGNKEWYPWAAEMLVQTQQANGSWSAPYPWPVGTCFALLILKRSNLVSDLQLTVRQPPPRPGPGGPTIVEGRDAILGSIAGRAKDKSNKKTETLQGVPSIHGGRR